MSLTINADDFGKSENVNKAITDCFNLGYIDRTTIMVNMPYALKAADLAESNGFMDKVGLHINLTSGRPLTEQISKNPEFCDEEGNFTAAFYYSDFKRLHMSKSSVMDIMGEIKAQINMYNELGFTLNHIDSHHHVHTNYPVLKALKKLSHTYSFSSIRLSRNLYKGGKKLYRFYKYLFNRSIKKLCANTTDYFGSFEDAIDYFAITASSNFFDNTSDLFRNFCNKYDLEIMVHPKYSDEGVLMDMNIPFEKEILLYETQR